MGWFSNNNALNDYHALTHAIILLFEADTDFSYNKKLLQGSFLKQLSVGFSKGDSQFLDKAKSMEYVMMASLLRKCSDFVKKTHAQTINAAIQETGKSPSVKNMLFQIAKDCDIPTNYLNILWQ